MLYKANIKYINRNMILYSLIELPLLCEKTQKTISHCILIKYDAYPEDKFHID